MTCHLAEEPIQVYYARGDYPPHLESNQETNKRMPGLSESGTEYGELIAMVLEGASVKGEIETSKE